jgi:hypothetical protein
MISHPKIIETGMDMLSHPNLIFYESGYSLHTLRQASGRSWRIAQRQPVRVWLFSSTQSTRRLRGLTYKPAISHTSISNGSGYATWSRTKCEAIVQRLAAQAER